MEIGDASAIVTGGASGLGEATARLLAANGMHVVIVDLNQATGEAIAEDVKGRFIRADVSSEEQVGDAVKLASQLGPLRVLVNCAGVGHVARTVGRDGNPHDLDAFARIISINLIGTFNCIRLAAVAMSTTTPLDHGERGSIVNTASVAAFDGQVGQAAYSASKGGIVGMTLPVARDLAVAGIRVNTIAPGLIDTPIYAIAEDPEAFKKALERDVLFPQRLGTPDEFARLALELVTNSYMNAEVIRIDGGARLRSK